MEIRPGTRWTAFEGTRRIATGGVAEVATRTKEVVDRGPGTPVLIFDDETGEQVEIDVRGTAEEVARRLAPPVEAPRGPGRPRLGVVAREVTLLPRQWEWLNGQPGGASVALRKLVEEARRYNAGEDRVRRSREAAYRFMSAIAGNLPGFEEAIRALFAGDRGRFDRETADWPGDVREHARRLASTSFSAPSG
ncbi:MAG TPA: DUF2239 family protein [Isosphaeraceae bacterium]|jgi:hypothetical protein|nr:DUF2239 family protein [Isosphaeraceae bacterium]